MKEKTKARKDLVIVESPAKSVTLEKYLGSNYLLASSMGHFRDLPRSVLGIDLKNDFRPHYEILPEKRQIVKELKKLARSAGKILIASDPDREGEAIAYHLREVLSEDNKNIFRVLFSEFTRDAVLKALQEVGNIDLNKFNSQQMRRILDRLAGYKISPILQKISGAPLSAGRVQSVALKLIVEREKEIEQFKPQEYWTVNVLLEGSQPPQFEARLEKYHNKELKINNQQECEKILAELKENDYILQQIVCKEKKLKALPPLITSTLQQEAFRRFKLPVKRTMRIAQELYEGVTLKNGERVGLITYMRTDSFRLAESAIQAAQEFIRNNFGSNYLPEKAHHFKSKAKVQDAHEAIRPTLPLHKPQDLKQFLSAEQLKIYTLIWERFLASQMKEPLIEETTFRIGNGKYLLLSKGERVIFEGYYCLFRPEKDDQQKQLPLLKEKEVLKAVKVRSKQNFTTPPARYTEAALVKELEEKGIGRPSTYARIIDILNQREYVQSIERRFHPTDLGKKVVEFLDQNFEKIMDYGFTAEMEEELDLVAAGKLKWQDGVKKFYQELDKYLQQVDAQEKLDLKTEGECPQCGAPLVRRYSRKAKKWFVGCSRYPECNYIEKNQQQSEELDRACPQCGARLVKRYSSRTSSYFIGCSAYPQCKFAEAIATDLGSCPQCGRPLVRRRARGRRQFFVGCSGYPNCNYIQSHREQKKEKSDDEQEG